MWEAEITAVSAWTEMSKQEMNKIMSDKKEGYEESKCIVRS